MIAIAAVGCRTGSTGGDRPRSSAAAALSHQLAEVPTSQTSAIPWPKETAIDLGGGVKMDLVFIPAGSFPMGSETGHVNEKPIHKVTITKPFYLGKYEVTQEQWRAVMGDNPSRSKGPHKPVENVSWNDCQAFLKKLSEKMPGRTFRLPTEAQWEHACRAGTTTEFFFGNNPAGMFDYAWWADTTSETHPVGEKKPNPWGLFDMYGNVWEWCSDWWAEYTADEAVDPSGPASGSDRALRGGAWSSPVEICRSASRIIYFPPEYHHRIIGCRIVVDLP